MLTTQEIADQYFALATTGEYDKIQNEMYADDCISIEPNENF